MSTPRNPGTAVALLGAGLIAFGAACSSDGGGSSAGDTVPSDVGATDGPGLDTSREDAASDTDGAGVDPADIGPVDGDADGPDEDAAGPDADAGAAPDTPESDPDAEVGMAEVDASPDSAETDVGPDVEPLGPVEACFADLAVKNANGPDYDQFEPTVGSHCKGTNHQDISGIEQFVVLGDSVAQGTPNDVHPLSTENSHFWRNLLAEWAAVHFDLDKADGGDLFSWGIWKTYDYVGGTGGTLRSGDFKNCAKWGARTDDLLEGGAQIHECFPEGGSDERTLVVMTMGGNDIAKITQEGAEASPEEVAAGYPETWKLAESTVDFLEEALHWLTDPERFPNGSYVVFATPFEFTDATGKTSECQPGEVNVPFVGTFDLSDFAIPVADLAGYGEWEKPEVQEEMVIWINEQFGRLAVETQTDMIFMLESFCGHGFVATGPDADEDNRCYRGPDAKLWFDVTCIHPNAAGHHAIFEMFQATILE